MSFLYFGIVVSILWNSVFGFCIAEICDIESLNNMESGKPNLSTKELTILRLIADGHTSSEIAEDLCLSLPTIKWYRKCIRVKFDADTTVEVVRKAISLGII